MKKIAFYTVVFLLGLVKLNAQNLNDLEKQKDAINLAAKINEQKIKLVKLEIQLNDLKENTEKAQKNSLKAANKVVSNNDDQKDAKLTEKSIDAANNVQKMQNKILKVKDKIDVLQSKISDLEKKMAKLDWTVQLFPKN
jgi:chromosome segregation ATPase